MKPVQQLVKTTEPMKVLHVGGGVISIYLPLPVMPAPPKRRVKKRK